MIGTLSQPFGLTLATLFARAKRFDQAHAWFIRALNKEPQGIVLCRIYVGLAQTEFQRCHFLNARHYAKLCLEQMAQGAVADSEPQAMQLLEEASWYYQSSAEEALKHRRRALQ